MSQRPRPRAPLCLILLLLALLGLPLLGITRSGQPLAPYLEFPPLTRHVAHAPFAWPVFIALAVVIIAALLPFERHVFHAGRRLPLATPLPPSANIHASISTLQFLALLLILPAWVVAWTRFPLLAPLQLFTFSPLWLGYILIVNAWTLRRAGRSLLTHRPRFYLALFPASAAFWWFFEYLNRFVQNWHYIGCEHLTPVQYFWFATLPFATVLPAVLATAELLATFPRCGAGLDRFRPLRLSHPRRWAAAWLVLALLGLAGIGRWPDLLFPLLWIAPLVLITAAQCLCRRPTLFAPLARGDWQRLYRFAAAALICGFFWEMWNFGSAAKWIYAIPYVHRFQLFEMPVLGYAGYLPFGLECAVIADALASASGRSSDPTAPNPDKET